MNQNGKEQNEQSLRLWIIKTDDWICYFSPREEEARLLFKDYYKTFVALIETDDDFVKDKTRVNLYLAHFDIDIEDLPEEYNRDFLMKIIFQNKCDLKVERIESIAIKRKGGEKK